MISSHYHSTLHKILIWCIAKRINTTPRHCIVTMQGDQ